MAKWFWGGGALLVAGLVLGLLFYLGRSPFTFFDYIGASLRGVDDRPLLLGRCFNDGGEYFYTNSRAGVGLCERYGFEFDTTLGRMAKRGDEDWAAQLFLCAKLDRNKELSYSIATAKVVCSQDDSRAFLLGHLATSGGDGRDELYSCVDPLLQNTLITVDRQRDCGEDNGRTEGQLLGFVERVGE